VRQQRLGGGEQILADVASAQQKPEIGANLFIVRLPTGFRPQAPEHLLGGERAAFRFEKSFTDAFEQGARRSDAIDLGSWRASLR
jgi:hypothetical protein